MTPDRQALLDALLHERYAVVVREHKPDARPAPLATRLDWLRDGHLTELQVVAELEREAS